MILTNPLFWFVIAVLGVAGVFIAGKKNLLSGTAVAVVLSLMIAVAYFNLIDHYLMDMQGLDYWYLFRK